MQNAIYLDETSARPLELIANFFRIPIRTSPYLTAVYYTNDPVVGVGRLFCIKSRFAAGARLEITHASGEKVFDGYVPPNCRIRIKPVSATNMHVRLRLEPYSSSASPTDYEWTIWVRGAALQFVQAKVPWFGKVGKPIPIRWNCPRAKRVEIQCDDGYKVERRMEANSGSIFLFRETSGKIIIRLIATDEHNVTVKTWVVRIFATAPRIKVKRRIQCARPGEPVMFSWVVVNATEVWLEAPSRDERHVLEHTGKFVIPMGDQPEDFVLMARHLNITRSVTLSAIPWYGLESPHT